MEGGDRYENVYACLLGEWVNLSNTENVIIDNSYNDVNHWYKEKSIHCLITITSILRLIMFTTVFIQVSSKF